jgi:uncharacterized protein YunC (DUF1805 family)
MNLHAELVNLWLFVLAIAKTVLMCGYVAIPVALAECQSVHFNIAREAPAAVLRHLDGLL